MAKCLVLKSWMVRTQKKLEFEAGAKELRKRQNRRGVKKSSRKDNAHLQVTILDNDRSLS